MLNNATAVVRRGRGLHRKQQGSTKKEWMKTLECLQTLLNLMLKIFLEIPWELALVINQWINKSTSSPSQKFIYYKTQANALWIIFWFSHRSWITHSGYLLRVMEVVHRVLNQKMILCTWTSYCISLKEFCIFKILNWMQTTNNNYIIFS